MGKLHWYRRDPNKALVGMKGLSLEERGAYNTVLDLIYAHDGAVDDDDRFIAGWLGVDVRVWRRLRTRLLDVEKLYVEGATLRNRAADVEVDRGLSRVASAQDAGKASARKRGADQSENNDLYATAVETPVPTTKSQNKKATSSLRSDVDKTGAKASRGTRLPDDWLPDEAGQKFAVDTLGTLDAARHEFEKFRDYWRAAPGQRGVKLDWPATWRTWCRTASERRGNRGPPARGAAVSFHEIADRLRGPHETPDTRPEADAELAGAEQFDFGSRPVR